jgi:diaminopimelate decarboxylase
LIKQAKELDMELVGVSFHVGSGCGDAYAFVKAALDAHKVFKMAELEGFKLSILDIGGGFPGDCSSKPSFPEIVDALRPVLDDLFPNVNIIAEPGRYFACASHTLACNVFAKRELAASRETDEKAFQYYVNDGVYQSFNCLFFDHAVVTPHALRSVVSPYDNKAVGDSEPDQVLCRVAQNRRAAAEGLTGATPTTATATPLVYETEDAMVPVRYESDSEQGTVSVCDEAGTEDSEDSSLGCEEDGDAPHLTEVPLPLYRAIKPEDDVPWHCSTIFGPTCDALDCISKNVSFPELDIGDWVYFTNMGAYTVAAASAFNGFYNWRVRYVSSINLDSDFWTYELPECASPTREAHGTRCPSDGHVSSI